jgi:hypothetical protein
MERPKGKIPLQPSKSGLTSKFALAELAFHAAIWQI